MIVSGQVTSVVASVDLTKEELNTLRNARQVYTDISNNLRYRIATGSFKDATDIDYIQLLTEYEKVSSIVHNNIDKYSPDNVAKLYAMRSDFAKLGETLAAINATNNIKGSVLMLLESVKVAKGMVSER